MAYISRDIFEKLNSMASKDFSSHFFYFLICFSIKKKKVKYK